MGSIFDSEGQLRTEMTDREATRKVVRWVVVVVVVSAVLTFAVWGLGIVTAPWVGRQNVHRIINAPQNIIGQNDHFFQLNADFATDVANLKTQAAAAERHRKDTAGQADPTGTIAQTQANLDNAVTGVSAQCERVVQQYNNDAQNYTKDAFLSAKLPAQLDHAQCAVPASR